MPEQNTRDEHRFHIVGIGASAGGLDPLETFFKNMPSNSGMAFVVVQHLSPDFKSQMEQLLSRKTRMQIHRVEDGVVIEPDNIYLIPPKKMMAVVNGRLLLTDKAPAGQISHPIDEFFCSLAQDAGPKSIGIVLSGTGADGSRGVVSIAAAGGLVLAQDEESAAFDGMPNSAMATGVVTLTLPPEVMPEMLLRYVRGDLTPDLLREREQLPEESDLRRIFRLLNERYKIDFSLYKIATVGRRIKRRLLLTNNQDLKDYWQRIESDDAELESLYKDLLIGVTRFFRDTEMYSVLELQVAPRLISVMEENRPLRIWVAGCATGEEAYSLAILFHEQLTAAGKPCNIKIFATDVHPASIKTAGNGFYSEEALQGVSEKRRSRYFNRAKNGYTVCAEIRKLVSFATHNVITDAPFTKLDLITCRNLLIYLQSHVQKKVISVFHFSLNTGGILALGSSETVGDLAAEFEEVSGRQRIYRKKRDVRLPAESRFEVQSLPLRYVSLAKNSADSELVNRRERSLLSVYDRLLEQFLPPSYLLDEKLHIVHIFGGGEQFLRLRSGRTSTYFLDLIEEEAKTSFAGAINHVVQKATSVNYTGIRMRDAEGNLRSHQVSVQPIYDQRTKANYFFIKLTEQKTPELIQDGEAIQLDAITRDHIDSLEVELRFTQENLQATIEELETANEEMQASNEELVASNEELQSTNEELQSVNEELYTVNYEYQKKIHELVEANDDMDNLLATTRVGVIFMDRDLCIRRYTPEISRVFNFMPQDVGRPVAGFTHTLMHPELIDQLRTVVEKGEEFEIETCDLNGNPYILRLLPYRSAHTGECQGVLLTLIDIQSLKSAQVEVARFKMISDLTSDGNALVDTDAVLTYVNPALCQLLQYSAGELLGMRLADLVAEASPLEVHNLLTRARAEKMAPFESSLIRRDQSRLPVEMNLTAVTFAGESLVFVSARNITQRLHHQRKLRDMQERAEAASKTKTIFLANISHELRTPLTAILGFTELLQMEIKSAGARDKLDILRRNSLHLLDLLNDLLDLSKIESGFLQIAMEECDLLNLLSDVQAIAINRAREKSLDLTFEILNEVPQILITDPIRYRQVVTNLLSNAIKYTEKGSVNVTVRRFSEMEQDCIELAVTDTGRGIVPAERDNLFKPFVRGSDNLTRKTPGSGLGLSISQQLARQMGGEITFDSTPGRGSQFRFTLPLRQSRTSAPVEPGIIEKQEKPLATALVPALRCRLMIVDDHEDIREYLRGILRPTQAHIITADNGQEAVDHVRAHLQDGALPDLILMDFHMPVMNGQEAVAAIRALGVEIPIIAITAGAMKGERERCLLAGFSDYLSKPFDIRVLLDKVTRFLQGSAAAVPTGDGAARDGGSASVKKLLVVDDNVDVTLAVKELLQAHGGFQVETVFDGKAALERLNSFCPDAVLLDMQLPDIDGLEVVRRAAGASANRLPQFVAMTGYADVQEKQRALSNGFSEYLVKPFTLTEMISALEAVLDSEP
jgi:two-component system CheB/CheR fusion protein